MTNLVLLGVTDILLDKSSPGGGEETEAVNVTILSTPVFLVDCWEI